MVELSWFPVFKGFLLTGGGNDHKDAKRWNKTRKLRKSSGPTINIDNSISANGTISGTICSGTINSKTVVKRRNHEEDEIDEFFQKPNEQQSNRLAHSFIINPDDETYIQNNVFTSEELEEIRNMETKDLPEMPTELLKYLGSFRKKTTEDLRIVLEARQNWEEYESDTLQRKHLEQWYNIHVWSLIDKSFNELEEVVVSRGESCSLASSKRKNSKRIIQGLVATTRKALGRRGDLILRKGIHKYGASEVGKDYEGDNGTKLLKERGLKSPKMLKDMLVDLGNFIMWETNKLRQLELVSFIHAGLFMILLRMDAPAGYVCRITRSDTLQLPTNVKCFEQALKCIVLTWKAKAIIRKTIDIVEGTNDNDNEDDALEELQKAGVRKCKNDKDLTIISNCIKTPQKKRTVNT
ncbi:18201_t:CDS:2 [Funneliformis geosporum]|uniref:18201_t:CDS:1 n=1 Tax=Funneliformis geosporum TaxID=1117311 RepID=A0A9W4T676_9GLOM|nr:18201_t:CDS:2 [Funneliformis geosporum]